MSLKEQMEHIYGTLSPEEIPWNLAGPPQTLMQLVESQWVLPCRAVDLGCGAGNSAVWLATQGFDVTGIDVSPRALELGKQLARSRGVSCRFVAADLLGDVSELGVDFDFAYDWEVLHHVFPEDRDRYVANVQHMLRPGGKYLTVCFSEDDDPSFGGGGKYRETPLGTTLYFSSEEEIRTLLEPRFDIEELCTVEVAGKYRPHKAVKALSRKRG